MLSCWQNLQVCISLVYDKPRTQMRRRAEPVPCNESNLTRPAGRTQTCPSLVKFNTGRIGVESRPPLVPYNESSLTRLLKDALAGDARLLVLACVSAAPADHDATLNTLAFAQGCRSLTAAPKACSLLRQQTPTLLSTLTPRWTRSYARRAAARSVLRPRRAVYYCAGPHCTPPYQRCMLPSSPILRSLHVSIRLWCWRRSLMQHE